MVLPGPLLYNLHELYRNDDIRFILLLILIYCLILFLSFVLWSSTMQIICITFLGPLIILVSLTWKQNIPMKTLKMVISFFKSGLFQCSTVSLLVEGVLTVILSLICFSDQIKSVIHSIEKNQDAINPLVNIHIQKTTGFYIYIFLTSFLSAGFVEESTKLIFALQKFKRIYKERDFFKNDIVYTLLLCSSALSMGYSTSESILYLISRAHFSFTDALLRCLMSMPFHVCCGILSSLRWLSSNWGCMTISDVFMMLIPSVLLHGLYDFITHLFHPLLLLDDDEGNIYSIFGLICYTIVFVMVIVLVVIEWESLRQHYQFQKIF